LEAICPSMAIFEPLTSRIRLFPARLTTVTEPPTRNPRPARNFLVSSLPDILVMVALSPTLHMITGRPGTAPVLQDALAETASMSIIILGITKLYLILVIPKNHQS